MCIPQLWRLFSSCTKKRERSSLSLSPGLLWVAFWAIVGFYSPHQPRCWQKSDRAGYSTITLELPFTRICLSNIKEKKTVRSAHTSRSLNNILYKNASQNFGQLCRALILERWILRCIYILLKRNARRVLALSIYILNWRAQWPYMESMMMHLRVMRFSLF